ncbi:hypothetical protein EAF04_010330 [Stromatinia cepivora]|nr:hypothetical protein EAF04_010330 [Stromatinia cepivora]
MRPISLLTAVILPLALAAPVPDKDTAPQVVPLPPAAAILAPINDGLATAAQKAGGSTSATTSKRQGSELAPILGLLGDLGSLEGILKERDENTKRQLPTLPDLGNLDNLDAILEELGPVTSEAGKIAPVDVGGIVKRQDIPLVGSLPGVADLIDDLPIGSPQLRWGGLKERAKRQEAFEGIE